MLQGRFVLWQEKGDTVRWDGKVHTETTERFGPDVYDWLMNDI